MFKNAICLLLLLKTPLNLTADTHFYRTQAEEAIGVAASTEHVSPSLLAGICWHESKHKAQTINQKDGGTGSYGLCQIKLAMARSMGYTGDRAGLLDPYVNALMAARILNYHKARTDSVEEQLAAYNAGRVRLKDGVIRNIKYVRIVMKYAQGFRHMETQTWPTTLALN